MNAARFQLDGWVPRKVDVPVVVPFTNLDMSPFVGKGPQQGEKELPADKEGASERFSRAQRPRLTLPAPQMHQQSRSSMPTR